MSIHSNPKTDITNLSREQLSSWLKDHDIAPYRAVQIFSWVYVKQLDSFDGMTNIKKDIRALLENHFIIPRLDIAAVETAQDGCKKFLFTLSDGNKIESVLIPERTHDTLCISSQVGCAQGCRFCMTAKIGFVRNLTPGEIIAQVRDVKQMLGPDNRLTNIVFMGMGEPLANYQAVVTALQILTSSEAGLNLSPRKITISTAGLVPKIIDLGRELPIQLAISLNATDGATRTKLMPINRRYPLETLLSACKKYPLPPRRKITFEYILIRGVNDSLKNAHALANMLWPERAKINLIPFNPHQGCTFGRPDDTTVREFQSILLNRRFTTNVRLSKGTDISAACGQLHAGLVNDLIASN
jgi:23S rRNA (adenine2503-C2)-methyltransferase